VYIIVEYEKRGFFLYWVDMIANEGGDMKVLYSLNAHLQKGVQSCS
jgi:hypothetical protein